MPGKAAHGGAVAVAVIGPGVFLPDPLFEPPAVAPVGIGFAEALHIAHQGVVQRLVILQRLHHGPGYRQRHHGVVGEAAGMDGRKQGEVLGADIVVFINGAHDVADDRTFHSENLLIIILIQASSLPPQTVQE